VSLSAPGPPDALPVRDVGSRKGPFAEADVERVVRISCASCLMSEHDVKL